MDMLKQAIKAAQSGNKTLARQLFHNVARQDPTNELVWQWLAYLAESIEEKSHCLDRVLRLDPKNEKARAAYLKTLLKMGVDASRSGDKVKARELFSSAVALDPQDEKAWFWMAAVSPNHESRNRALERVLAINPNNERALQLLSTWTAPDVQAPAPSSPEVPAKTAWKCPFCAEQYGLPPEDCVACGAILSLKNIEAFFTRPEVNMAMVSKLADRLELRVAQKSLREDSLNLALAYLNLKRMDKALEMLTTLVGQEPRDSETVKAVAALRHCLEATQNTHLSSGDDGSELTEHQTQPIQDIPGKSSSQPDLTAPAQTAPVSTPSAAIPLEAPAPNAKVRIMIVDDSSTVRKLVTITLERSGFEVVSANNGTEALSLLSETLPDLIFLDITMPRMDGYQLCKLIRQNERTQNIPIVMLTGKDGIIDRIRGKMSGAREYITKPFEASTLISVIQKHCRP